MITVYYLPSPNGKKVTIALEEMGLPYDVKVLDIFRLEGRSDEYLSINPNGKIPAITDGAIKVFESGAILQYLGRKTGLLYPADERQRSWIDSWLFWQMSALGPMSGQITWFRRAAQKEGRDPCETSLALHRYGKEVRRLYGILEKALTTRDFICDVYSIADIACWTWVDQYGYYVQDLMTDFPRTVAWHARIAERPAVQRAQRVGQGKVIAPEEFQRAAAAVEAAFGRPEHGPGARPATD